MVKNKMMVATYLFLPIERREIRCFMVGIALLKKYDKILANTKRIGLYNGELPRTCNNHDTASYLCIRDWPVNLQSPAIVSLQMRNYFNNSSEWRHSSCQKAKYSYKKTIMLLSRLNNRTKEWPRTLWKEISEH